MHNCGDLTCAWVYTSHRRQRATHDQIYAVTNPSDLEEQNLRSYPVSGDREVSDTHIYLEVMPATDNSEGMNGTASPTAS